MRISSALLAASLAAYGITATGAPAVYRCGNEYTDAPCANGMPVDVADPRSAEQRADARAVAVGDKRLAAEMERDRRLQQASERPAQVASRGVPRPPAAAASAPAKPARKGQRHKAAARDDKDFIAIAPASARKGGKASSR